MLLPVLSNLLLDTRQASSGAESGDERPVRTSKWGRPPCST